LRVAPNEVPTLTRIVVAIDPSASSGEEANETGIVCAGIGIDGHGYVLEDASKVRPPGGEEGWAAEAVALLKAKGGDRIVAEVNNGGEMVEATIRVIDPNVPFKKVHASRGKVRSRRAGLRALRTGPRASRRRVPAARRPDVRVHVGLRSARPPATRPTAWTRWCGPLPN
jgi:phage terminase large subunit-like protein